jgi:hypothetical protein
VTADFAFDMERSAIVLDPDYERYDARPYELRYYDWQTRCWRVGIATGLWPGCPAAPADPDAALDAAAPHFKPQNTGGRPGTLPGKVEAVLREYGPQSAPEIAARLGVTGAKVQHYMYNHGPRFENLGRRGGYVIYALRGD